MTRLEKDNPIIKELSDQLGLKVYYRGKAYWAGSDLQLTGFQYETINGVNMPINEKRSVEIAESQLRKLKAIKDTQDAMTVPERVNEVINGMMTITVIPNNFCTFGYECLDHGTLFIHFGKLTGWLYIKGFPEIKIEDFRGEKRALIGMLNDKFFEVNNLVTVS